MRGELKEGGRGTAWSFGAARQHKPLPSVCCAAFCVSSVACGRQQQRLMTKNETHDSGTRLWRPPFKKSEAKAAVLSLRAQELCVSRGGRPGLPVPDNPFGLCGRKATMNYSFRTSEPRNCVKVEMAVPGSISLIVLMVSVDVKQH